MCIKSLCCVSRHAATSSAGALTQIQTLPVRSLFMSIQARDDV